MTMLQLQNPKLSIAEFLARVRHMPDLEAEQELLARKDLASLEYNLLLRERQGMDPKSKQARAIGVELLTMGYDNNRVNEALAALRRKMDRLTWARAVTAVFGRDGYAACREWMAANDPDRWRPTSND